MAHRVRHGDVPTEAEDPEKTKTQPPRPTSRRWTLCKVLAHASTLGEHSFQPYTERMLQDWPTYERKVLEGHTGTPATTSPTTRDDLLPDGDISALANIPLDDSYDPDIVNAILAYHSWTTQQHVHLHSASDDPREWHPIGATPLELYLHEDAAPGAHTITDPRPATQEPIPEPYIAPSPARPPLPSRDESPLREHDLPALKDAETTTTVQHMPKFLTNHHFPDNCQLPRGGNNTHGITPTWRFPRGTIIWKESVPRVVTREAVHLITTKQIKLSPAEHFFITIQGAATIKGATLRDDDQMCQARPPHTCHLGDNKHRPRHCHQPRLRTVGHPLYRRGYGRRSKKKCFSIALRHTLVVLEMH